MECLPLPRIDNWRDLYKPGASVRCIKSDPPMKGFGKPLKAGDVVAVHSVCWSGIHYQIGVRDQCAFYDLEGYFEVVRQREPSEAKEEGGGDV